MGKIGYRHSSKYLLLCSTNHTGEKIMTEFSFLGGRSLTFNVLILTYLPIFIIAQTIKTIKSVQETWQNRSAFIQTNNQFNEHSASYTN